MFHIILLAAGLSRRMGADNKLLLPWGNKTVLETTIDNILAAQMGHLHIVVGHEAKHIKNVLKNYSNRQLLPPLSLPCRQTDIITNLAYEQGMTTSIQAGITNIDDKATGYMICLSDMPLIAPSEYRLLFEHFLEISKKDKKAIIRPIFNHQKGNPTIFSAFYKKDILHLTYTEGCKPIVQKYAKHVYEVQMPTESILKDMDNREDYERLLKS